VTGDAQPEPAGGLVNLREGLRLSLGTFTVLPVGPVRTDRRTAGLAMLLAPLVGAGLGAICGGAAWLALRLQTSALVAAAIAVGLLALLTRGMHLDGLADTADGLGTGRDPARALAAMKDPHVGVFGVVTLGLTLLVQSAALADQMGQGRSGRVVLMLALAVAIGRGNLPWACRAGVRAARPDGLGATVAGSVDPLVALGTLIAVVAAVTAGGGSGFGWFRAAAAALLAWAAVEGLLRRCLARFGGITGDVLGAVVEVGTTVALIVLSTAPYNYYVGVLD
jgi:adenosylcobinamide-GDP ribazoletransferase